MRNINRIIIHCTATPAGRSVSVDEVRAWHIARGFSDIGYHYLIDLDGSIRPARSLSLAGAHCRGYNANSVGIAYVGGLSPAGAPADTRTPAQIDALRVLVRSLCTIFPIEFINGHNEFSEKACPCFNVHDEFFTFVENMKKHYETLF
ncbi:N-acetylmuramoyl-L-alanine amidase [Bacteroides pyogenes]|uniref:N-acetylmuramoyl-L-alanine amidase n=1 Tax=Bacteroides pyogenes TaxID=310300 RepID=UPI001BA85BB3|nr:N-acetylmuramoyl-L-alanine amidase [Bacteroides pyogenes]MBR8705794.1 hypothetical protein [Bacteroides pyogenes]